jgi:splicing factor 45
VRPEVLPLHIRAAMACLLTMPSLSLTCSDWSSALAFAPVRRPQATKVKPPKASAALFFTPTPGVSSGSQPTDAVRSAAPVLRALPASEPGGGRGSGSSTDAPTAEQPTTRALPALTLEGDSRKRPQAGPGPRGGGGGKKKRKKGRPADNLPAFNPDEAYDPTKPNDIEAYLRWRTDQRRARERARKERESRRYESASESSDGSYYSEDERDDDVKPAYKGASRLRVCRAELPLPAVTHPLHIRLF